MRPGAGFNATAVAAVSAPAAVGGAAHSAWHSPVPYLFGGLAAMLGLIAFALLILACSYWKLSGYLEGGAGRGDNASSATDTDGEKPVAAELPPPIWEEKILVIMAGEAKPTYLATPMSSRASSFGDRSNKGEEEEEGKKVQEIAMASIKDTENSEHSEGHRDREEDQLPEWTSGLCAAESGSTHSLLD